MWSQSFRVHKKDRKKTPKLKFCSSNKQVELIYEGYILHISCLYELTCKCASQLSVRGKIVVEENWTGC